MELYPKMNSKNTALLIIDMVNGCCHKKCEKPGWGISFSKIRKMVPKLNKFIEDYRKAIGGLIIFTNNVSWKKEYLTENINELYTDPKVVYYSNDNSDFPNEFYIVSPQEGDIVITKNHYDAFTSPELDKVLKQNGIQYLIVTGVFTDGCVLATTCGGFSKGYNFIFLKDLIETTDVKKRQELQKYLKEYTFPVMYGKTIKSKDFLMLLKDKFNHI
ncbi:MAG: cysteine hydrolase [Candidatus Pacebacteria bacterium]|nr:cysteine hydrolase [Candidatus Paceibacterota bacterium]